MGISKHLQRVLCIGLASASMIGLIASGSSNVHASHHHTAQYIDVLQPNSNYGSNKSDRMSTQHYQDVVKYNHLKSVHHADVLKYNRQAAQHQLNVLKYNHGQLFHQRNVAKIQLRRLQRRGLGKTSAAFHESMLINSLNGQLADNQATQNSFKHTKPSAVKQSKNQQSDQSIKSQLDSIDPNRPIGKSGEAFQPSSIQFAPRPVEFVVNGQMQSITPTPAMLSNSISDNVSLIDTYLNNYMGHEGLYTTNLQITKDLMNSNANQPIVIHLQQGNAKKALGQLSRYDQKVLAAAQQSDLVLM